MKQTHQLFDEMRTRSNSIANSAIKAAKNELTTPLRRSERLLNQNPQDLISNPSKTLNKSAQKPSSQQKKSSANEVRTPCRRSQRLCSKSEDFLHPRSSSALSKQRSEIRSDKDRRSQSEEISHRSKRLLNQNPQDLISNPPKPQKKSAQKPSSQRKKSSANEVVTPCRRSLILCSNSGDISHPRSSSRLSKQRSEIRSDKLRHSTAAESKLKSSVGSCDQNAKKSERRTRCIEFRSRQLRHSVSIKSNDNEGIGLSKAKRKASVGTCNEVVQRSERSTQSCASGGVVLGLQAVSRKASVGSCNEFVRRSERSSQSCANGGVVPGLQAVSGRDGFERNRKTRKRKRGEEAIKESVKGWTKEQEMALQSAYIVAKPTPNFWKKVAKLVPGKSAKDCYDRIHSDHITPTQPLPRSRAKKIDSSPLRCFSLSASKLLGSSSVKAEKSSRSKRKSYVTHKTVRQLLQKHNRLDLNHELDLFSVLEPSENPSRPQSELNSTVSTPKKFQEKQGFLQQCNERSGQKKASRLRTSSETEILSPPVLKQVKNKALHEKYIDQLHCREAKRKSIRAAGKENNGQANVPKIDMVRTAKNALVSDAVNAIKTLQHLQTKSTSDSSDNDDDALDMDGNESDDP